MSWRGREGGHEVGKSMLGARRKQAHSELRGGTRGTSQEVLDDSGDGEGNRGRDGSRG